MAIGPARRWLADAVLGAAPTAAAMGPIRLQLERAPFRSALSLSLQTVSDRPGRNGKRLRMHSYRWLRLTTS